ncbi:MAG TPA: AI-2E family transporter [bacterium]|nr:AI-2E family transporter [bacterium]
MNEERHGLRRMVTDPQFVALFLVLGIGAGLLYVFGFQLIPFIAAFLLAYFLDAGVQQLTQRGLGRGLAVGIVFTTFLIAYGAMLAGPVQLVARRAVEAAASLPASTSQVIERLQAIPDPSFGLLPESIRQDVLEYLLSQTHQWFSGAVTGTIGLLPQVTSGIVFVFLVPVLVFFFLKDKDAIIRGCVRCLPRRRELLGRLWGEMEAQMGNYVRGKIWEILVVGFATGIVFALLGFQYPALFGILSGLSVVIPYVGAIGLAVPVFALGLMQWGMSWPLAWLLIAYTVIQLLDGYVLVPYIFSETVKLHPVLILLAVFIFGSLWGFWGILFAIPLATFVKALINAMLEFRDRDEAEQDEGVAQA